MLVNARGSHPRRHFGSSHLRPIPFWLKPHRAIIVFIVFIVIIVIVVIIIISIAVIRYTAQCANRHGSSGASPGDPTTTPKIRDVNRT